MRKTNAGALIINADTERLPGKHHLIAQGPSLAFQTLLDHLYPEIPSGFEGIHPTAVIHPSATLAPDVHVGPYAVIDKDVTIGPATRIGAHVHISPACVIGKNCHLDAHVTLGASTHLGNNVWIQSGSTIGTSGFGYATDEKGYHQRLRQVGHVIIEDDVEIGALTAIDRARFGVTRIRRGTKIDNLVQIAHGVEVGEDNLIAGQTGIAGSTKLGKHVVLGGQVAITGHATLVDETENQLIHRISPRFLRIFLVCHPFA